jgi:HlyD family secretion protein
MAVTSTKKSSLRRRNTWLLIGGILIILIAGGLIIAQRLIDRSARLDTPQTGDVVTAFIGDLAASATASGKVEAEQNIVLSANTPGLVEEVYIREGMQVKAGDPLVQFENTDLALQLARAQQNVALKEANLQALLTEPREAEVVSARAAVSSAQAVLDELLAGPGEYEIAESEATVRQQQAGVSSAAGTYQSTLDSISGASLAAAEAELISARIAYDQAVEENERITDGITHEAMIDAAEKLAVAQAKVDELRAGANQGELNSASAEIAAASANLAQAQANQESLLTGPSADEIAAAEATLAQARSNLTALLDGPSTEELTIAEAELAQAELALVDAQEVLEKATIVAPTAGVVTAVFVTPGERTGGEVVELITSQLKVVLRVDEIDVGLLAPGQPAVVTLETWPTVEIPGEIVSIAPSATNDSNGVVTYDVQINLTEPEALPIRVGMTANARLITAQSEDVLLVPNAAITADRQNGTYSVNLVTAEEEGEPVTQEVVVTIGFRDDNYTQITSGLNAGDEVLVGELEAPIIRFGNFGGED